MGIEVRLELWVILVSVFVIVFGALILARWMWVRHQNAYHELVNEIHRLATKVDGKVQDATGEVETQRAHGLASGLRFAAMMIRHRQFGGPKPQLYGWE